MLIYSLTDDIDLVKKHWSTEPYQNWSNYSHHHNSYYDTSLQNQIDYFDAKTVYNSLNTNYASFCQNTSDSLSSFVNKIFTRISNIEKEFRKEISILNNKSLLDLI